MARTSRGRNNMRAEIKRRLATDIVIPKQESAMETDRPIDMTYLDLRSRKMRFSRSGGCWAMTGCGWSSWMD